MLDNRIQNNRLIFNLDEDELRCIIEESVAKVLQKMPQETVDDTLLTRKEVAKLLKVSLVTLNQWRREGIISQQKIKSRVYFLKSQVMRAINNAEEKNGRKK